MREREDVRLLDTCKVFLMGGLATERVRETEGEEAMPLMKQTSTQQGPTTETWMTLPMRTSGFRWKVGGRLVFRKHQTMLYAKMLLTHIGQDEITELYHGEIIRT